MPGISGDVENELEAIEREAHLLDEALRLVANDVFPGAASARLWLDTQGIASGIVKIYSGCERIIARLAASVDKAPLAANAEWHAALLRRAVSPYPGVRGAMISSACYDALNRFRAFRHRERSSYGTNLDLSIVVERGNEMLTTFRLFQTEILDFITIYDAECG